MADTSRTPVAIRGRGAEVRGPGEDPRPIAGSDDPNELVGVAIPATRDDLVEMARCLVEELAMVGYDPARVRHFFMDPFYEASYRLTHSLGAEEVDRVIASVFPGRASTEDVGMDVADAAAGGNRG